MVANYNFGNYSENIKGKKSFPEVAVKHDNPIFSNKAFFFNLNMSISKGPHTRSGSLQAA